MIVLLSLLSVVHGACTLEARPDAAFEVTAPDDATGVRLVLLVRVDDANLEAVKRVQEVLDARSVHAGFSVRLVKPSEPVGTLLEAATDAGHEAVVRLLPGELPVDPSKGAGFLKKKLSPIQRWSGKIKAIEAPMGKTTSEAILQRMGLRSVMETNGPAQGTPRPQRRFDGQPNLGAILPAGPYSGPCGDSPVTKGLTPGAADRVTQALYGARSGKAVGIVRLTLVPDAPEDAVVLARWLDEIILPKGILVGTPREARTAAMQSFRSSKGSAATTASTEGGRLVRLDEVREAAAAMEGLETIPRLLPGNLAPTEAFQAFVKLVAGDTESNVVRLGALEGPMTPAKVALKEATPFEREDVAALARALLADLPHSIPGALPVAGTLLSAPELFTLMASAARGDDPPMARPIASPEPNARGLGWGRATTP